MESCEDFNEGAPQGRNGSGGGGSWDDLDSNVPKLSKTDDFSWVNPDAGFIVNGKVYWTAVRHDLWGRTGIEAAVMADALDLYYPTPTYRTTTPQGVKPDDMLLVMTRPGSCTLIFVCKSPKAQEKDKVWYFSRMLKRVVVLTWDDTFWNGERKGDGYFMRDGQRFVRFDEVVPAFGGVFHVDERGLVWVQMPSRQAINAGEACVLQQHYRNCDMASFLTPEGIGTWGEDSTFWLLGWEADTGGKDGVYQHIVSAKNIYGLKHNGTTPGAMAVIQDAVDAAVLIIPTALLLEEGANAALWRYAPSEAVEAAEAVQEQEYRTAIALAAKVPADEVAKYAEQLVGEPVLPEGTQYAPGRGWYYIVRSMNKAPADFQMRAALSDVRELPEYPGKFVMREFGTRAGGPLVDNYIDQIIIDAKGNYVWVVKDGEINPAFVNQDLIQDMVRELRSQINEVALFGDKGIRWLFGSSEFRCAFERYLIREQPALAEKLNSTVFFYDLPGFSANP